MPESLGFADSEPMYQYYDWQHNLRLELFMDGAMERGCGIDYKYSCNNNMEKITDACGFMVYGLASEEEWEDRDIYAEMYTVIMVIKKRCDKENYEKSKNYDPWHRKCHGEKLL